MRTPKSDDAPRMRRIRQVVGEHGGAGADRDAQEGQAPDADERDALRQRQRLSQRVAERVPGKSGEQMAAQPFRAGERGGERQYARRPAHPDQPRRGDAQGGVEREIGRQSGDRDRQQPAEGLGIDQKGVTDPVEAGEKIAEAEAPAGDCRGPWRRSSVLRRSRPPAKSGSEKSGTGSARH